jgi:hypothetical protein
MPMHVCATYLLHLAHVGIPGRREYAIKQHSPREAPVQDLGHAPAKQAGSYGNTKDAR